MLLQLQAAPTKGVCVCLCERQHVQYHVSHMTSSVKHGMVTQLVERINGEHLHHTHHTHTPQECLSDLLGDNRGGVRTG